MNTEINLAIRKRKQSFFIDETRIKKIRLLANVFLFAVAGLAMGLFMIISASPKASLQKQEEKTTVELSKYQPQFGKYLLIRSQLGDVKSLLLTRPDIRQRIDTIQALIPPEILVSTASITEKTMSMTIETSSLDAMSKLFSSIQDKAQAGKVPATVTTSAITYSPLTNQYSLQVTFD